MRLKYIEVSGFKSFAKKTRINLDSSIVAIVGPNGSGKSNISEAIRFALGEQSFKSMRGKIGQDLIFSGPGSKTNRARVDLGFDNSDRSIQFKTDENKKITLNYDEVVLSREIYSDGQSRYLLNNSEVRLKDINELLSGLNIGSTGHQIISQGQTDKILNASEKDRQEMVEDSLGLKVYHYKIRESKRKLDKTKQNIQEIESIRRELAPHIRFLKKSVEKIEKARELEIELRELYKKYLSVQHFYIQKTEKQLVTEEKELRDNLSQVQSEIEAMEKEDKEIESSAVKDEPKLSEIRNQLSALQEEKQNTSRFLGKIEAKLEFFNQRKPAEDKKDSQISVSLEKAKSLFAKIKSFLTEIENKDRSNVTTEDVSNLQKDVTDFFEPLVVDNKKTDNKDESAKEDLRSIENEKNEFLEKLKSLQFKEKELIDKRDDLQNKKDQASQEVNKRQRLLFEKYSEKRQFLSDQKMLDLKKNELQKSKDEFQYQKKEADALIGQLPEFDIVTEIDQVKQEELRKKLERVKIKYEEMGVSDSKEVISEYKEVTQRDEFLASQLQDLNKSLSSLESLIKELNSELHNKFKTGIEKINKKFFDFFRLMFDGGQAKLKLVSLGGNEENEQGGLDTGLQIDLSLPKKKVKSLEALSGGERSLTSIALLFAMSQVNPPPFLVLDETDAALDESNSKRYGNMLADLSKYSQLLLVTHNRQTMSEAQLLYGVTMTSDGISRLLSVKLEDAESYAK